MEVAKKTGAQFSLIMADIDDFKKVNDTYGHDVGDQVLVHVATIMKQQLRGNDYICRWGGEEMLLLISNNGKVATQVAERIRQALENNPVATKDGNKITVGNTVISVLTEGCEFSFDTHTLKNGVTVYLFDAKLPLGATGFDMIIA
jgi:diguanylate cyclase (GGDEF)-like protein